MAASGKAEKEHGDKGMEASTDWLLNIPIA